LILPALKACQSWVVSAATWVLVNAAISAVVLEGMVDAMRLFRPAAAAA
jgi:hypothetical protein